MQEASRSDSVVIPDYLVKISEKNIDFAAWLEKLPATIRYLQKEWGLLLDRPFDFNTSCCSWVAPCVRNSGGAAVLKVGFPHMEAEGEQDGLLFWDGSPTVFLFEADREKNALLLERCLPGESLRTLPEEEQDQIVAGLLKRLWRQPLCTHSFRPLSDMISYWNKINRTKLETLEDPSLAKEGIFIQEELILSASDQVVLATDLHAGNVLRAEREPWLVIDPKPFWGDPAYDASQHLLNCRGRLESNPCQTIGGFSDLLSIDYNRTKLWLFSRLAAESDLHDPMLAKRIEQA
jgi:streptomycin 6-kinase